MKNIIAILGHIGSGKDTAAKFFIETHSYIKISFADSLKDTLSSIFLWDRQMLEGTTAASRNWRNTKDEYWSSVLGKEVTPRKMMQEIGTDLFRHHFSPHIWTQSLVRKVIQSESNIVVADVRFVEEYNALSELGATFIRINRNIPEWEETALLALTGDNAAIQDLKDRNIHESEWRWLNFKCDYTLDNTGSIHQLRESLSNINL